MKLLIHVVDKWPDGLAVLCIIMLYDTSQRVFITTVSTKNDVE